MIIIKKEESNFSDKKHLFGMTMQILSLLSRNANLYLFQNYYVILKQNKFFK